MIDNFIIEHKNALSDSLCDRLIEKFENNPQRHTKGRVSNQLVPEKKEDTEICVDPWMLHDPEWKDDIKELTDIIKKKISEYVDKYSYIVDDTYIGLKGIQPLSIEKEFNIQRFLPGEGFKVWHCESGNFKYSSRVLVWMVYLNDIKDAGGTLFTQYDHRCQAEKGKLVIWPSGWTHYHKSEISPTETKYIVTGWSGFTPF